jgi:hypothetical protein
MAEEINEGDWISYPEGEGKVVGVSEDGYGVRPKGLDTGIVLVPKGDRVRKMPPKERQAKVGPIGTDPAHSLRCRLSG